MLFWGGVLLIPCREMQNPEPAGRGTQWPEVATAGPVQAYTAKTARQISADPVACGGGVLCHRRRKVGPTVCCGVSWRADGWWHLSLIHI